MNLPVELLLILSVIASVLVWLLKKAFVEKGQEVPVWVYNIVLGAVSLLLSLAFAPVVLPPLPSLEGGLIAALLSILAFLGALVPVLSAVVGFAKIIYEVLLQKILDGLGSALKRLVSRVGSDIG